LISLLFILFIVNKSSRHVHYSLHMGRVRQHINTLCDLDSVEKNFVFSPSV